MSFKTCEPTTTRSQRDEHIPKAEPHNKWRACIEWDESLSIPLNLTYGHYPSESLALNKCATVERNGCYWEGRHHFPRLTWAKPVNQVDESSNPPA